MNTKQAKRFRPKWSLATSFWFCFGVAVIVVPVILLTGRQVVWMEFEMITGVLAAFMFVYFTILLHQGRRILKMCGTDW